MIIRMAGKVINGEQKVESKYTEEVEQYRKDWVDRITDILMYSVIPPKLFLMSTEVAMAATNAKVAPADQIREGFKQIIDVFTALAEPILWFYALMGCIMMATGKNRDGGWKRIKQVGYAYVGICLLPTFFSFLRWVGSLLGSAIHLQ